MAYFSRSAWGARPAKYQRVLQNNSINYVFLHHTTGDELSPSHDTVEEVKAWVRAIQRQHQDSNGWSDIAYHFLVDRWGNIYEGRGWGIEGAATYGYNSQSYAICFLGDGSEVDDNDEPAAYTAIRNLFNEADYRVNKPLVRKGHRDVRATACPGNELYQWLRDGMPVATPPPPLPPTPAPAPTYPSYQPPPMSGPVSNFDIRVKTFQGRLRERGWNIGVDGIFGVQTVSVVKAFQKQKNLTVDGIVGPKTWAAFWTAPVT